MSTLHRAFADVCRAPARAALIAAAALALAAGPARAEDGPMCAPDTYLAAASGFGDTFGTSVAISGDGTTIVVGAKPADGSSSSAGYVYGRTDAGYDLALRAAGPCSASADGGCAAPLAASSAFGDTVAFGFTTPAAKPDGLPGPAVVAPYRADGAGGYKGAPLLTLSGSSFGRGLAVDAKGTVYAAADGPKGEPLVGGFVPSGDTYKAGPVLTLKGDDAAPLTLRSLATSGADVVVGVGDPATQSGSADVLRYADGGGWKLVGRLTAADSTTNDQFGFRVAANDDTVLVAAPAADEGLGAVYAFKRDPSNASNPWLQVSKITAADGYASGGGAGFGWSVAMSGDGTLAAVAELGAAEAPARVHVFRRGDKDTYESRGVLTLEGKSFGLAAATANADGEVRSVVAVADADAGALLVYDGVEMCFAPADSDGDGIPDEADACPDRPAGTWDFDGDGCPDGRDQIRKALAAQVDATFATLYELAAASGIEGKGLARIRTAEIMMEGPKGDAGALGRFEEGKDVVAVTRTEVAAAALHDWNAIDATPQEAELAVVAETFAAVAVTEAAEVAGPDDPDVLAAGALLDEAAAYIEVGGASLQLAFEPLRRAAQHAKKAAHHAKKAAK